MHKTPIHFPRRRGFVMPVRRLAVAVAHPRPVFVAIRSRAGPTAGDSAPDPLRTGPRRRTGHPQVALPETSTKELARRRRSSRPKASDPPVPTPPGVHRHFTVPASPTPGATGSRVSSVRPRSRRTGARSRSSTVRNPGHSPGRLLQLLGDQHAGRRLPGGLSAGGAFPASATMAYNQNTPNLSNAAVVPLGTGGAITVVAGASRSTSSSTSTATTRRRPS